MDVVLILDFFFAKLDQSSELKCLEESESRTQKQVSTANNKTGDGGFMFFNVSPLLGGIVGKGSKFDKQMFRFSGDFVTFIPMGFITN